MITSWVESIAAWIGIHPIAAGGAIFLLAFCDALIVIGIIVPSLPLWAAIGAMIGLGHLNGFYAVACAAAGAFCGDGLSYWIGRKLGPNMHQHWPFTRYPKIMHRSEAMFRHRGGVGIVIGRYVGATRPFVPAIAGMLRMPIPNYLRASAFAAITWAAGYLAPGWLFGASYYAGDKAVPVSRVEPSKQSRIERMRLDNVPINSS